MKMKAIKNEAVPAAPEAAKPQLKPAAKKGPKQKIKSIADLRAAKDNMMSKLKPAADEAEEC